MTKQQHVLHLKVIRTELQNGPQASHPNNSTETAVAHQSRSNNKAQCNVTTPTTRQQQDTPRPKIVPATHTLHDVLHQTNHPHNPPQNVKPATLLLSCTPSMTLTSSTSSNFRVSSLYKNSMNDSAIRNSSERSHHLPHHTSPKAPTPPNPNSLTYHALRIFPNRGRYTFK